MPESNVTSKGQSIRMSLGGDSAESNVTDYPPANTSAEFLASTKANGAMFGKLTNGGLTVKQYPHPMNKVNPNARWDAKVRRDNG